MVLGLQVLGLVAARVPERAEVLPQGLAAALAQGPVAGELAVQAEFGP